MKAPTITLICLLLAAQSLAQTKRAPKPQPPISIQTATTKDGRTVLLKSDGTWEYSTDPVVAPTPSAGRDDSAAPAIKALRLMAGATEVGINFQEYSRRLIDVKADVDKSLTDLPSGELSEEIGRSLQSYVDAAKAWNDLIRGGRPLNRSSLFPDSQPFADSLQRRYEIPVEIVDPSEGMSAELLRTTRPESRKPFRTMDGQVVLKKLWASGRAHLEKAEALVK